MSAFTDWLKKTLNELLTPKLPPIKEGQYDFDPDTVKWEMIKSWDVQVRLKKEMLALSVWISDKDRIHNWDGEYILYDAATIRKVFKDRYKGTYEHRKFLEGKIAKPLAGQDCDNSAEIRSYFCHKELPACVAISLCQPGHRFMGVMSIDEGIIWYNGHPRNKECIYAISY